MTVPNKRLQATKGIGRKAFCHSSKNGFQVIGFRPAVASLREAGWPVLTAWVCRYMVRTLLCDGGVDGEDGEMQS